MTKEARRYGKDGELVTPLDEWRCLDGGTASSTTSTASAGVKVYARIGTTKYHLREFSIHNLGGTAGTVTVYCGTAGAGDRRDSFPLPANAEETRTYTAGKTFNADLYYKLSDATRTFARCGVVVEPGVTE